MTPATRGRRPFRPLPSSLSLSIACLKFDIIPLSLVLLIPPTHPGIDIDWLYPGYKEHGGTEDDRDNFNKLLLEVREALNAYQEETGNAPLGGGAYGLTAALPCGPEHIDFLDVPFLSEVLDGLNLMTYDFHNEEEPRTGTNSPLFDQEWDEVPGLSVDGCVTNYRRGGAGDYAEKINVG